MLKIILSRYGRMKQTVMNRLEDMRKNHGLQSVMKAEIHEIDDCMKQVIVKCPYCRYKHIHGFHKETIDFRSAHCNGKDYSIDIEFYKLFQTKK